MAKFSFKRPRIISKKFPRVDSTIDGVTKSLNDLVFSYSEQVDKSLHKKRILMAISSMVLLLVLGSFISPKGKAESSVFYPETCLGGWINPQYAQGEEETTSNGDAAQFNKNNSAVLPKNTNAEMYCGNFKGTFDTATKPTKIIVSLALTKGPDLSLEDRMEHDVFGTTSPSILEGTSTEVHISIPPVSSSSSDFATSSIAEEENNAQATTTETGPEVVNPSTTREVQATSSVLNGIIESFQDTIDTLFSSDENSSGNTDTVVVPPPPAPEEAPAPQEVPVPQEVPAPEQPVSLLPSFKASVVTMFFQRAFAQEETSTTDTVTTEVVPPPVEAIPQEEVKQSAESTAVEAPIETEETFENVDVPTEDNNIDTPTTDTTPVIEGAPLVITIEASSTPETSSSTVDASSSYIGDVTSSSTVPQASSTEVATTTEEDENQFQNNFLEVLYTFDGVTWTSLGELNEISMKYRTFEIPVTASTSWSDMSHLQIKVVSIVHTQDTPTVYLDSIKVEVLYDSAITHEHPDFSRDTILKDEIVDNIRFVTLINHENSLQEIWYMYLDEVATSSEPIATSTSIGEDSQATSTPTTLDATSTYATSTDVLAGDATSTASTTDQTVAVIDLLKNKWRKYEGNDLTLGAAALVKLIKEKDLLEEKEKQDEIPDFSVDTVKKIKGTFLQSVIVQIERVTGETVSNELWLYDSKKDVGEKIGTGTSTSISVNSPLGVKDGYVFWLSEDRSLVFAYNLVTKEIYNQTVPTHDIARGERGELMFDGIPWKVIVGADGFSFFSDATGEVFSDENGTVAEILRQKLKLDSVLDKEELSNLNFQVEETGMDPNQ